MEERVSTRNKVGKADAEHRYKGKDEQEQKVVGNDRNR